MVRLKEQPVARSMRSSRMRMRAATMESVAPEMKIKNRLQSIPYAMISATENITVVTLMYLPMFPFVARSIEDEDINGKFIISPTLTNKV